MAGGQKLLSFMKHFGFMLLTRSVLPLKLLSVTTNVVGLQTDDAGHVDQNSSAHVARFVGLQTDAVVVTETRLRCVGKNFQDIVQCLQKWRGKFVMFR